MLYALPIHSLPCSYLGMQHFLHYWHAASKKLLLVDCLLTTLAGKATGSLVCKCFHCVFKNKLTCNNNFSCVWFITIACSRLKVEVRVQCKNVCYTQQSSVVSYEHWLLAVVIAFQCDIISCKLAQRGLRLRPAAATEFSECGCGKGCPFPRNRTKPNETWRNRAIIIVKCVTKMYQIAILVKDLLAAAVRRRR